jgi:hypothetical protein
MEGQALGHEDIAPAEPAPSAETISICMRKLGVRGSVQWVFYVALRVLLPSLYSLTQGSLRQFDDPSSNFFSPPLRERLISRCDWTNALPRYLNPG